MSLRNPWTVRDSDLATFTFRLLVNRTDVWGAYRSLHSRRTERRKDGSLFTSKSFTAPRRSRRGQVFLSSEVVLCHFRALDVGHIIGLHALSQTNTCKWVAIDIDNHGDSDPALNFRFALFLFGMLVSLGLSVLLIDSDGKGGFHLWLIFREPIAGEVAYHFARWIVREHANYGFAKAPETYPKQASATYGNWLRLFGRHHTTDHRSRVWGGSEWLEGERAIDFILGIEPNDPASIPADAAPPAKPESEECSKEHSSNHCVPTAPVTGRMTDREVALRCLSGLKSWRADEHGDGNTAGWINVGLALCHVDSSADMLAAWDQWSRQSVKYVEGECAKRWRSFGPSSKPLGVGSLVKWAREDGFEPFPVRADDEGNDDFVGSAPQWVMHLAALRPLRRKVFYFTAGAA